MNLFILGVVLVFVKTNLQLLDTGVFYYVTNAAGYLLIHTGIRQLREEIPGARRLLAYVLVMVLHSVGFAVLNGTGHSIRTIPLSGGVNTMTALILTLLAVVGMAMVFYILHEVLEAVRSKENATFPEVGSLEKVPGLLLILMVITCVLFFTVPSAASFLMIVLMAAELVFVASFSARVRVV
ncbi:hypothetical protein ABE021_01300 [Sporosarcina gallistercoris]|uniref:hypothetical protein n=1 Tax=Sporosarcina gallistercoris TaxID=2762245 RepID=UPI003D2C8B92